MLHYIMLNIFFMINKFLICSIIPKRKFIYQNKFWQRYGSELSHSKRGAVGSNPFLRVHVSQKIEMFYNENPKNESYCQHFTSMGVESGMENATERPTMNWLVSLGVETCNCSFAWCSTYSLSNRHCRLVDYDLRESHKEMPLARVYTTPRVQYEVQPVNPTLLTPGQGHPPVSR